MALPKIDVPVYTTNLPSTGEVIKFRPFLVREQKQLLIALGGGAEQQTQAIYDIVRDCTFDKITNTAPAYDIEHMFIQIRSRSVGESIDLILTCGTCEHKQDAKLDLTTVQVQRQGDHKSDIDLGHGLMVSLTDPSLADVSAIREQVNADAIIKLIAHSIKTIWKDTDMYAAADYTEAELIEFVENLSPANLETINEFFSTLPVLRHNVDFKCNNCGADNSAVLEGLQSFFV